MKLLLVVHGFPPSSEAGSEVYAHAHAQALVEQHGHEICVLTREADPSAPEYRVRSEQRRGFSVVWINNTFRNTRSFAETYANAAIGAIAACVIDDFGPDVVHVHHLTCLSTTIVHAVADRGIPCFYTLHDYWLLCHRGQFLDCDYNVCSGPEPDGCERCLGPAAGMGRTAFAAAALFRGLGSNLGLAGRRQSNALLARLAQRATGEDDTARTQEARARLDHMRGVIQRVTQFLAPSESLRNRFIAFGVPADRIALSPYGFDRAPFDGIQRTTSRVLRIGFLGSVMISKAPHLLLEAFTRLPAGSATVDLFGDVVAYHGDDSYRQRLAPLLETPGVRVHGGIAHDRVPAALASIDVLVVPSMWPENSPLVIREAFMAGVPVIGARIGGIPEAITHGVNGLLFTAGDAADLHAALARLVNEPDLLPTLANGIPEVRAIADDVAAMTRAYGDWMVPLQRRSGDRMAAIVLNYGTPDETRMAVLRLLASRRALDHLIVVDNDPRGACRDALHDLAGSITYVAAGRNLGFSGGMNLGIRLALQKGAQSVLLVNSDVIVPPDCAGALESAIRDTAGAGIAGPLILSRAHPDRIASAGLAYAAATGRMRHSGVGGQFDAAAADGAAATVTAVSGCVMLITADTLARVGLLDEDYFFSFEDLDYCLRARAAGIASVLVPRAVAYHEGGRSMGGDSPRRLYFAARNHLLAAKRASKAGGRLTAGWRTGSIIALNIAHAAISGGGTVTARLGAVARGTRDYFAGRFGEG